MYNGHLSIEEIEQFIQQKGPAEYQSHVEICQQCRSLLEDCQAFNAKLDKLVSVPIGTGNAMNCPDGRVWFDVAAGILPETESLQYVQHAAECSSCGQQLKAATRMFEDELSPEEESILASLPDNATIQEPRLTQQLGTVPYSSPQPRISVQPQPGRWNFWRPLYALPALATIAVAVLVPLSLLSSKISVQEAYQQNRHMPYRPAVSPYGPNLESRGDNASVSPIKEPDQDKKPCLAAEGKLLEKDPDAAISILSGSGTCEGNSAAVLDDLVVAYASKADLTSDTSLYTKALDLSKEVIRRYPQDATAYFNQAMIYERQHDHEKACEKLREFLSLEPNTPWSEEAKSYTCPRE